MRYKAGDPLPGLVKEPVARVQLVRYAGASGDFNPIHFDDEAARSRGLGGVIDAMLGLSSLTWRWQR